ncbi:AAA family ATPase [Carboxydocella sp. ULO1]|uniref:AAA family ATPase n=1 Tax=Carboxydocella sp. ULO1 TaxID=1926599 RepID=UPI0009AF07AE|nr:AAA family ATPase [Carboxydocella sp. ULO1]GAW28758.1 DNA sulfur modification protein DndD [Carboxydocella sp. ULO1]
MLLKSLEMINFRQYKGKQKIIFSTNKEKNVTVILGKNTSGKTTLIQAFNWALYGNANFDTKDFLLNLEIANQLKVNEEANVQVSIELIHNDIEYLIVRKQPYRRISNHIVKPNKSEITIQYKLPNGQTEFIKQHDIDDTINKILPEELSRYFFFDGERIGNLGKNDKQARQDLAKAVKTILGLTVLDNAISHLSGGYKNSVIGKLKRRIDAQGNEKLMELQKEIEDKYNQLEEYDKNISSIEDAIKGIEEIVKQKKDIILNNKETFELQKEINELELEINNLKEEKDKVVKNFNNDFCEKAPLFFMQSLMDSSIDALKSFSQMNDVVPYFSSQAIEYVIDTGKCICGREIAIGSEEYKYLVYLKSSCLPLQIENELKIFINNANNYKQRAKDFYNVMTERYEKFREYKYKIYDFMDRINNNKNKINFNQNLAAIQQEIENYETKLKHLGDELRKVQLDREILSRDIQSKEQEANYYAQANKNNLFIDLCIKYAEEVNITFQKYYKQRETEIRSKLQTKVNDIFSQMYHGKRKILIDESYKFFLKSPLVEDNLNVDADPSKGLETVMSFAFVSGIVDLAKEKITNEHIEFNTEPYPLVMDAPFSNADEEHVTRISKILPEIAEQVIMFIMHKDWKHAESVLSFKLDKMYELNKISETYTEIKEC